MASALQRILYDLNSAKKVENTLALQYESVDIDSQSWPLRSWLIENAGLVMALGLTSRFVCLKLPAKINLYLVLQNCVLVSLRNKYWTAGNEYSVSNADTGWAEAHRSDEFLG